MYERGQGVSEDDRKEAEWLMKLTKQGDADSQSFPGAIYATAEAGFQDFGEAHMWFNIASAQGNEDTLE